MIAFSFVGTEADEFACGKCRLRWLRQQLWGLSIGSAVRRIGSRERWTAKIRLSEEAFPPCGDGSGRWLCPQPFNRLYSSGMWRQGLPVPCRREVYFCGKMPARFGAGQSSGFSRAGRRSVPEAGRIRFCWGSPYLLIFSALRRRFAARLPFSIRLSPSDGG